MLFFVISGYCVVASAESGLQRHESFWAYLRRRGRRIYVPYLLSLAVWAGATILYELQAQDPIALRGTTTDWVQNLTMTQWLTLLRHPVSRAADNPTLFVPAYWSLCYQEQFYIITGLLALIATRMRLRLMSLVASLTAIGVAWNILWPRLSFGIFIEYWAEFGVGALVFYRLCRARRPAVRHLIDTVLAAILGASLMIRFGPALEWGTFRGPTRVAYDELAIASGVGLALVMARRYDDALAKTIFMTPLRYLGMISYSLYLVHMSTIGQVASLTYHLTPRGTPPWLVTWTEVGLHIAFASIFWWACERPFLNKKPRLRTTAPRRVELIGEPIRAEAL